MRRPPRTRRPGRIPRAEPLEPRALLSLGAIWLGQDGSDFAGRTSAVADGLADIHVRLTGAPPGTLPSLVDVRPLGGGRWRTDGQGGGLIVARTGPTADSVDLYFDPYQSDPVRPYQIDVSFAAASPTTIWLTGGPVDGNLRVGSARVQATWLGQQGTDLTGPRDAVGPDGLADARISLANLSGSTAVNSLVILSSAGERWSWGPDRSGAWNAEASFSAGSALVSIGVDRDLADQSLTIVVSYADGTTDTAVIQAGPTDPGLSIPGPGPLPAITWGSLGATWLGQDGLGSRLGDVHARIDGLPAGRTIAAASLSDLAGYSWAWTGAGGSGFYTDSYARGLILARDPGSTTADLFLDPVRDESGTALTLRLLLDDGTTWIASMAGGPADPALRAPAPSSTSITAQPGDDLAALANQYGQVNLSAGTYALSSPLILGRAVSITADPGAVLLFNQPAGAAPWTAAIKIMAGRTTLAGFSVRFAGPVRWDPSVSYGPAVIGLRDDHDPPAASPLVGTTLRNLDLQGPPRDPTGDVWQEAVNLVRLAGGECGTVDGNTLRGGTVEFLYGPWTITNNTYNGTLPGTYSFDVFAGHSTHDLVLANNRAEPVAGSGKTWRFLVLTVGGYNDTVRGNTSIGIGPRDGDSIPNMNAAEVVLTESYRLAYEGSVASVSADGRLARIFNPQGNNPRSGDALAVLDGPGAGQYRRILLALDPNTVLLDAPLPSGTTSVSIATGFVGTTFDGNTIDARGGSVACDLVLGGNLFGVRVTNNTLLGGGPFQITAAPSESPVRWGWSQAPALGLTIAGNTFQDNVRPGFLGINRSPETRTASGRVYVSAAFRDNVFATGAGLLSPQLAILGDDSALDPGEVRLDLSGNRLASGVGAGVIHVGAATIGGSAIRSTDFPLGTPPPPPLPVPPAAPGLVLANDTGTSPSDGVTSDPTIVVQPSAGAVAYEYRVVGSASYRAAPSLVFRPEGLPDGNVAVEVRAVDANGLRSDPASIRFQLLTNPPGPVAGLAVDGPTATFQSFGNGSIYQYQYAIDNPGGFVDLGTATTFNLPDLAVGVHQLGVRALDGAGNVGPASWLTIDRTPPPLAAVWLGQDGRDYVGPTPRLAGDGLADAHVRLTNLAGAISRIELRALGANGARWRSDGKGGLPRLFVTGSAATGTYDLYFQPARRETGRTYQATVFLADGSTQVVRLVGGPTVPGLALRVARLRALKLLRR